MTSLHRAACLLTLVCLLALAFMPTVSANDVKAGVSEANPKESYDLMLDYFRVGAYDTVLNYYERMPSLRGYEKADLYQQYARARLLVDAGQYQEAHPLFHSLPEDFPEGVADSLQWGNYAYGMRFFVAKEYKKAAEYLRQAKGLANASARLSEAERLWMEEQYDRACGLLGQGQPELALPLFEELGDFQDSAAKLEFCQAAIMAKQSEGLSALCTVSDLSVLERGQTSLRFSWKDSQSTPRYSVQYAPEGVLKDVSEEVVDTTEIALTGLIPDTGYRIVILPLTEGALSFTGSLRTQPASFFTDEKFAPQRIGLYSYSAMEERRTGLGQLIGKDGITELTDNRIEPPFGTVSGSDVGYAVIAPGTCKVGEATTLHLEWVLRLSEGGTYISGSDVELSENLFFVCLYASINELLDQAYHQQDAWPRTEGKLELYADGQLLGSADLILSAGQ